MLALSVSANHTVSLRTGSIFLQCVSYFVEITWIWADFTVWRRRWWWTEQNWPDVIGLDNRPSWLPASTRTGQLLLLLSNPINPTSSPHCLRLHVVWKDVTVCENLSGRLRARDFVVVIVGFFGRVCPTVSQLFIPWFNNNNDWNKMHVQSCWFSPDVTLVVPPFASPLHQYWIICSELHLLYLDPLSLSVFFCCVFLNNSSWWIPRWPLICAAEEYWAGKAHQIGKANSSAELWGEPRSLDQRGRGMKRNACTWKEARNKSQWHGRCGHVVL